MAAVLYNYNLRNKPKPVVDRKEAQWIQTISKTFWHRSKAVP